MELLSDPKVLVLAIIAVIIVGMAKGGFSGIGVLGTPVLALALPPVEAAALLLPVLLVQDVVSVWSFRHSWDRWIVAWMAPGALVVLRSTWDYAGRVDEFRAWLDRLDADGAAVRNPTDLVRWNLHKSYLLDLERRGVPVVPTRLVERGAAVALGDVAAEAGWDDVVVKPAVAATARLTVHEAREGAGATARPLRAGSKHQRRGVASPQPRAACITLKGVIASVGARQQTGRSAAPVPPPPFHRTRHTS